MWNFLMDVVWVIGDIIEFASRVGIGFCVVMFMLHLGGAFKSKPSNRHQLTKEEINNLPYTRGAIRRELSNKSRR